MRPVTVKNNLLLGKYMELVETIYSEPSDPQIIGSILGDEHEMCFLSELPSTEIETSSNKNRTQQKKKKKHGHSGYVKKFQQKTANTSSNKVIVTDSD